MAQHVFPGTAPAIIFDRIGIAVNRRQCRDLINNSAIGSFTFARYAHVTIFVSMQWHQVTQTIQRGICVVIAHFSRIFIFSVSQQTRILILRPIRGLIITAPADRWWRVSLKITNSRDIKDQTVTSSYYYCILTSNNHH